MCLRCQSNIVPFFDQSNSVVSLINSGFNNFGCSSDTNIFPDENLKSCFTKCNYIETPFNDSGHPVSIYSKYHDINDFNKLNINKIHLFQLSILTLFHYPNILKIYETSCPY